ncbi:MAG: hypothetical protein GY832_28045 [Chloroflexi bacterium]|nr:hypothetical protein [Chloroflexota bacterium]
MKDSKCMKCGSVNLDSGFIRSFSKVVYKSGDKPLDLVGVISEKVTWPKLQASLCLDCGHVELFCDTEFVKKELAKQVNRD